MTTHLTNDIFFTNLSTLLTTHSHGSIYLTQKRLSPSPPPPSNPTPTPENPSTPTPILIRATNGKSKEHRLKGEKIKLSTIVPASDLEKFFARYADVMKMGMSVGLRKRDRSGRKGKKKKFKGGEAKVAG